MFKNFILLVLNKIEEIAILRKVKRSNLYLGDNITFKGEPCIQIHKDAEIYISDGVTINSRNKGYHLSMFGPCKLMADKPNAKIKIGSNSRVHGSCIHAKKYIKIGNNCLVAANCQIMDSNGHDISFPDVQNRMNTYGEVKKVIIEDNVWLGTGVVVLPGVTIGNGSIISANSVVHKDIPPMVVAGGNPIKIIKSYT